MQAFLGPMSHGHPHKWWMDFGADNHQMQKCSVFSCLKTSMSKRRSPWDDVFWTGEWVSDLETGAAGICSKCCRNWWIPSGILCSQHVSASLASFDCPTSSNPLVWLMADRQCNLLERWPDGELTECAFLRVSVRPRGGLLFVQITICWENDPTTDECRQRLLSFFCKSSNHHQSSSTIPAWLPIVSALLLLALGASPSSTYIIAVERSPTTHQWFSQPARGPSVFVLNQQEQRVHYIFTPNSFSIKSQEV